MLTDTLTWLLPDATCPFARFAKWLVVLTRAFVVCYRCGRFVVVSC
jgi:hypothetical protein